MKSWLLIKIMLKFISTEKRLLQQNVRYAFCYDGDMWIAITNITLLWSWVIDDQMIEITIIP